MPIPNLLHPVPVEIQRIDRGATFYDADAREPVQHAARSAIVVLPAQVSWKSVEFLDASAEGARTTADGYLLFRKIDLDGAGFMLALNDRFVKVGWQVCELYAVRIQEVGHYTDQGGATLVRVYFRDRKSKAR